MNYIRFDTVQTAYGGAT